MRELDRLLFSRVNEAYPERWDRARPGNAFVNDPEDKPGEYSVRCQGGDWHTPTLVRAQGEFWGSCDCDGFRYHDNACAHLCAVFRLKADDRDSFHHAQVESISVELRSDADRQASLGAEPDARAATDGGLDR